MDYGTGGYGPPSRGETGNALKWAAWIGGFLLAVGLIWGVIGFVGRWAAVPGRVLGPENVEKQWAFAYDYEESLKSIAGNVCTAEATRDQETNPDLRSQRATQVAANINNYNRVRAEYDGRLRDAFRAGLVKPPDVNSPAPTLEQNKRLYC